MPESMLASIRNVSAPALGCLRRRLMCSGALEVRLRHSDVPRLRQRTGDTWRQAQAVTVPARLHIAARHLIPMSTVKASPTAASAVTVSG